MRRRDTDFWVGKIEEHKGRFRFRCGRGRRTDHRRSFETKEEAEAARAALTAKLTASRKITLEQALERYEVYKTEEGSRGPRRRKATPNAPFSAARDRRRVADFFGRDAGPLPRIKVEGARALYAALRKRPHRWSTEKSPRVLSDSEQQACLNAARRFGDWLVREGLWGSNPIADVAPLGRPKAGEESKEQLRRDEALYWLAEARRQAAAGDELAPSALAAAVCFIGALRVSEVLEREVRDLEDSARYLFIPKGKTRKARRRVKTAVLRDLLLAQAERAKAVVPIGDVVRISPPLFPGLSCFSVRRASRRICRAVGVEQVTTHALRASMISIGAAGGEALGAIADDVGHASEQITRRAYATAESQAAGEQERGLRALGMTAPVTAPAAAPSQGEEAG